MLRLRSTLRILQAAATTAIAAALVAPPASSAGPASGDCLSGVRAANQRFHGDPGDSSGVAHAWIPPAQKGPYPPPGRQVVGRFHHSSFLAGGGVEAAGEMQVRDGVIQFIDKQSGHYKPDLRRVNAAGRRLERLTGHKVRVDLGDW